VSDTEETGEIAKALSKLQARCGGIAKTGKNPHLGNRYSTLDDAWKVIRPHLDELGLAIVQRTIVAEGRAGVRTEILHSSGQRIGCELLLPCQGNRGTNQAQAIGSALTYAKRYTLTSLCGIGTDEHDDDGNGAGKPGERPKSAPPRPQARQRPPQAELGREWVGREWNDLLDLASPELAQVALTHWGAADNSEKRAKTVEWLRKKVQAERGDQ